MSLSDQDERHIQSLWFSRLCDRHQTGKRSGLFFDAELPIVQRDILQWTLRVVLATTGARPGTVTTHDIVLPSSVDDTLKSSQRLHNNKQLHYSILAVVCPCRAAVIPASQLWSTSYKSIFTGGPMSWSCGPHPSSSLAFPSLLHWPSPFLLPPFLYHFRAHFPLLPTFLLLPSGSPLPSFSFPLSSFIVSFIPLPSLPNC